MHWIRNWKFAGEIQLEYVKDFAQLLPTTSIKCLVYNTTATPLYTTCDPLDRLSPPLSNAIWQQLPLYHIPSCTGQQSCAATRRQWTKFQFFGTESQLFCSSSRASVALPVDVAVLFHRFKYYIMLFELYIVLTVYIDKLHFYLLNNNVILTRKICLSPYFRKLQKLSY